MTQVKHLYTPSHCEGLYALVRGGGGGGEGRGGGQLL